MKTIPLIRSYIALAGIFLLMVSCICLPVQARAKQLTLLDGKVITLPDETRKVACLFGPSFEKVFLLGAIEKIVLCSEFHQNMWGWSRLVYKGIEKIPTTNAVQQVNIEELLKIKPDVVFFWNKPDSVKILNNIGISVVYPSGAVGSHLSDAKTLLQIYAKALGKKEEQIANQYCTYFDAKLKMVKDIVSTLPESKKPRVYFAIRTPLSSSGKDTILPNIVEAAGGRSVTRDISLNYGGTVSMEQLLAWNPEFFIMDHCGFKALGSGPAEDMVADMMKDERFEKISAVKDNKVFISPTGVFFWDAGQQVILQVMWLAKILHPEKFRHIDMKDELKYFYSTFFRFDLDDDQAYRILNNLPPAPLPEG